MRMNVEEQNPTVLARPDTNTEQKTLHTDGHTVEPSGSQKQIAIRVTPL